MAGNTKASARQSPRLGGAARRQPVSSPSAAAYLSDATRRTEILRRANAVIATSGLRTSLQQIADAAGILAGSLYHHFESKEAILVELIRGYHADLDRLGEVALARSGEPGAKLPSEQLIELGCAIAGCAVEHRAALQMSFYEGPSTDPELIELTQRRPTKAIEAMLQTLHIARWSGYIRDDLDLPVLADRIVQSMLHVSLDVIRHKASSDATATLLCRVVLEGLAAQPPSGNTLDRSNAFAAAQRVIATWADDASDDDTAGHIRAVARVEFGRRGYEMTTVRDIAAAAGTGTATLYRLIGSKEALLMSIMLSFGQKVGAGWTDVLASDSTVVEKLDALSWVNINALDQFPDEFRIQLAWLRQSPPDTVAPAWSFTSRVREMKALLSQGVRSGDIRIGSPPAELLARVVIGVQWIPENILQELGPRQSLIHARDTVLRGVAVRSG